LLAARSTPGGGGASFRRTAGPCGGSGFLDSGIS